MSVKKNKKLSYRRNIARRRSLRRSSVGLFVIAFDKGVPLVNALIIFLNVATNHTLPKTGLFGLRFFC